MTPTLLRTPGPAALADAAAARIVTVLADAQAAGRDASLVVTGGGIGIKVLTALAATPALEVLDLARLDVWWGDERYVAADDPDRNEKQARDVLAGAFDAARLHPMGSSDAYGSAEEAAAAYAAELGPDHVFDVLLFGIGPEGHVASIFPHSPASTDDRDVFAVHDSPKPPPTRISLGYPAIRRARQVWILASGEGKAAAISRLLAGEDPVDLPAAGAVGAERTLVFVDEAALSATTG